MHRLSKINFLAPIGLGKAAEQDTLGKKKSSTHKIGQFDDVEEEQPSKDQSMGANKSKDSSMIIAKQLEGDKSLNQLNSSIKRTKGGPNKAVINLKKKTKCMEKAELVLNSWFFQGFMTTITVYCLFGDDVRQIAFNAEADPVFYILTIISFFAFCVEAVLSCYVRDDYWLGFYFWLDIISTISLIADVGWIMDAIAGTSSTGGNGSNVQQATKMARAGRGARIGTKAARLARIIRLIRLLRIVKLYKSANMAMEQIEEQTKKNQIANAPGGSGHANEDHKENIDKNPLESMKG